MLIGGGVLLFICCRRKKSHENNKSNEKETTPAPAPAPAPTPKAVEHSLDKDGGKDDTAGIDIAGGTGDKESSQLKNTTDVKDVTSADVKDAKVAGPLVVEPPNCVLPANGGTTNHKLNNTGTEKLVFKVESSNNAEYRLTPVYGVIEPKSSFNIEVVCKPGAPQEYVMLVRCGPAPAGATDAAAAFGTINEKSADTVNVPLIANSDKKMPCPLAVDPPKCVLTGDGGRKIQPRPPTPGSQGKNNLLSFELLFSRQCKNGVMLGTIETNMV